MRISQKSELVVVRISALSMTAFDFFEYKMVQASLDFGVLKCQES